MGKNLDREEMENTVGGLKASGKTKAESILQFLHVRKRPLIVCMMQISSLN